MSCWMPSTGTKLGNPKRRQRNTKMKKKASGAKSATSSNFGSRAEKSLQIEKKTFFKVKAL